MAKEIECVKGVYGKPTDEQVKMLWEWCGLTVVHTKESFATKEHYALIANYGDTVWSSFNLSMSIDLNNLFEYSPDYQQIIFQPESDGGMYCGITIDDELYEANGDTPELALFWAWSKVMDNG